MRTLRTISVTLCVAALVLAGCGDDDAAEEDAATPTEQTSTTGEDATTTEAEETTAAGSPEVEIPEFEFQPAELTVSPATEIAVTNTHDQAHTLTASGADFDTGNLDPDQTASITAPEEPGDYPFVCSYHPFMQGTLTVEG